MFVIVGFIVVIASVLGGFTMAGGDMHALIHPSELVTIGGAALGALIVMSPKSLLRHKDACSPLEDLANGEFQRVIGEVDKLDAKKVTRVVLCCGKVYYDLVAARREQKLNHIAIVRLEQLYPFPQDSLAKELAKYPKATEIVWCQEEPRNQGAWYWIASRHHLDTQLGGTQKLLLVSRPASSSPAVGYLAKHNQQQKALVESALGKIEY